MVLAGAGFMIFRKFPRNIIKLNNYITNVADGALPQDVSLFDSCSSNDLIFIENGLKAVIQQMQERIDEAEQQQQIERELRETIEQQQESLIHAEKHRAMVQSIAATCHHIGQPVTVLGLRMHMIKRMELSPEERKQVDECDKSLEALMDMLDKFRQVSEFRSEPYIYTDNGEKIEMLAV